jgi:hypothetical protein
MGLAWSRRKSWQLGVAATWVALIAVSRMYLGRHFPADVLGGLVVGVAALTLARLELSPTGAGIGKSESRRIVNVSRKFDTTGSGVSSFTPRALVLNASTLSWTCAFVNSAPSRLTVVDGHRCCRDARRLYTASRHLNGMFADTKPHESIPFELVWR